MDMDGSFVSPPAKRILDPNTLYTSTTLLNAGSSKRSKPPPPPLTVSAGQVLFRLLCHVSRIGGVIGKSGAVIKQLQQDTAAKIRVGESPPGIDVRVITLIASNSLNKKLALKPSNEEEADSVTEVVSPAQEALIRVFERILDVAAETEGVAVAPGGLVSCRLLAESSQVGAVIGKGGKVIEKIRQDTGCKIRVLSSDKLPACALSNDKIVEIEGNILSAKKALVTVSRCLQDCPQVDRTKMSGSGPLQIPPQDTLPNPQVNVPSERNTVLQPFAAGFVTYASGGHPFSLEPERIPPLNSRLQQQEVVFRLLCSNDRVGGVIGKGGTIVKAFQNETGASISIGASVAECDERLITITAMENRESQFSAAQNALILVFKRSIEAGIGKGLDAGSRVSPVSARLVVPSNQVGCLLGKGGTIISEMRKATGAGIRIIEHDQDPKCASENDEVVQITGEFVKVQDALFKVSGRLRDNVFPSRMLNGAGTRSSSSMKIDTSAYERARDPSSLGLHTSVGASHSLTSHTNLTKSMDHLGLSYKYDHAASPKLRSSQAVGGVSIRSTADVGRGLTSIKGGLELGSGSRSAIVMNTTLEIVVPENVIDSVYGENGSNLARIREISGAKVLIHEPHRGTRDRVVVISGNPDETQAAQSLLQAFILTAPS
ncbi:KH domain-containing protein HEN4 [Diospyros lotus]|uniref:KH domain-containing protein HEN4 n=1 Tax=Diospyros lotus TaxID=55363 RepID=UPI0022533538|nr:KH domain-containing protein HEN4 [Diospyros lotus]